ncbi:hypothetical protein ACFQV4_29235 [Streptomyces thermocarboxydus]
MRNHPRLARLWYGDERLRTAWFNERQVSEALNRPTLAQALDDLTTTGVPVTLVEDGKVRRGHHTLTLRARLTDRRFETTLNERTLRNAVIGNEVSGQGQQQSSTYSAGVEVGVSPRDHDKVGDTGLPRQIGNLTVGGRYAHTRQEATRNTVTVAHDHLTAQSGIDLYSYRVELRADFEGHRRPRGWPRLLTAGLLGAGVFVSTVAERPLFRRGTETVGRVELAVPAAHGSDRYAPTDLPAATFTDPSAAPATSTATTSTPRPPPPRPPPRGGCPPSLPSNCWTAPARCPRPTRRVSRSSNGCSAPRTWCSAPRAARNASSSCRRRRTVPPATPGTPAPPAPRSAPRCAARWPTSAWPGNSASTSARSAPASPDSTAPPVPYALPEGRRSRRAGERTGHERPQARLLGEHGRHRPQGHRQFEHHLAHHARSPGQRLAAAAGLRHPAGVRRLRQRPPVRVGQGRALAQSVTRGRSTTMTYAGRMYLVVADAAETVAVRDRWTAAMGTIGTRAGQRIGSAAGRLSGRAGQALSPRRAAAAFHRVRDAVMFHLPMQDAIETGLAPDGLGTGTRATSAAATGCRASCAAGASRPTPAASSTRAARPSSSCRAWRRPGCPRTTANRSSNGSRPTSSSPTCTS